MPAEPIHLGRLCRFMKAETSKQNPWAINKIAINTEVSNQTVRNIMERYERLFYLSNERGPAKYYWSGTADAEATLRQYGGIAETARTETVASTAPVAAVKEPEPKTVKRRQGTITEPLYASRRQIQRIDQEGLHNRVSSIAKEFGTDGFSSRNEDGTLTDSSIRGLLGAAEAIVVYIEELYRNA